MRYLAFLLCLPLAAQTISFTATSEKIGTRYINYVGNLCAPENTGIVYTPNMLQAAAKINGIQMATNVGLMSEAGHASEISWQRKAFIGLEIAAGFTAILDASEIIKIKEKSYSAMIPLAGAAIRVLTTAFPQPDPAPQVEAFPARIDAAPGQCVGFRMYGTPIVVPLSMAPANPQGPLMTALRSEFLPLSGQQATKFNEERSAAYRGIPREESKVRREGREAALLSKEIKWH